MGMIAPLLNPKPSVCGPRGEKELRRLRMPHRRKYGVYASSVVLVIEALEC